jgi:hypothetical protein
MKIKKYILLLYFLPEIVYSQSSYTRIDPVVDRTYFLVKEFPVKSPGNVGTTYLNEKYNKADVKLKPGQFSVSELKQIDVQLDLKDDNLEIATPQGIKILNGTKVEQFEWVDAQTGEHEVFVNCDKFALDGTKAIGFGKVLSDKKVMLLEFNYVEMVQAAYNPALDVGSKDNKIVKKQKLYLVKDGVMNRCDRKSILALLDDDQGTLRKYAKQNKINLNKQDGLKQLVDYYNSI